jgi:LacI family transcriptional regulator
MRTVKLKQTPYISDGIVEKLLDNVGLSHIFVEALPSVLPSVATANQLMGVTIYDLAREAGVGIGTASRCMNNHPHVSPATRARVLTVAKRLNYFPHRHARGLASKKSNAVSIVIPYITNYFFVEVLQGVQDKAAELGVDLVLYGVSDPSEAELYLRRSLHYGHVDGVLYFSMAFPESCIPKIKELNLPVVLVDTYHPDFDSFCVENREGARQATAHLARLGHRTIAMINANLDAQPARERMEGYREALDEHGLPFVKELIRVAPKQRLDGFNKEWGYAATRDLIRGATTSHHVTAVFIASDIQAIGALEAVRELGLRVPEDLAVVGFDDIELAQHLELTTMRQPMYQIGAMALARIMQRVDRSDSMPTVTSFVPELIIRQSCGAKEGGGVSLYEHLDHIQLEESGS